MEKRMPSLVSMFCALAFCASAASAETRNPVHVTAKVRDFKEANPTDPAGTHPNFNNSNGCSAQEAEKNTVKPDLDMSGPADGGAFPGDNRTPRLVDPLPGSLAKCFDPPDRFSDWYSDVAGVNRAFLVDLRFDWDAAAGMYVYDDDEFFPIDDGAAFTKANPSDPGTFGQLQGTDTAGRDLGNHNYGFTMEFHTDFTYHQGQGQVVAVQGEDDIWLFLNGKRAIDLGGVHPTQGDTVKLDDISAEAGLQDGNVYAFDFYFAERHTANSVLKISTNLDIGAPTTAIRREAAFEAAMLKGPVAIYDRAGRHVRTLRVSGESGAQAWDRRDARGRTAVPGIYFWRMLERQGPGAENTAVSGRIVVD
jgi:fibro-slime domain-containing protein